MKFLTIILLAGLMTSNLAAQNYKFGKVSKEELQETSYPTDTSANAAVLYRKFNVFYHYREGQGFLQTREIHERIKIYNKEGFAWATQKVRLYNESNSKNETLFGLKGFTYNLANGKLEEVKLERKEVFEEISNKYWKLNSFTMPNIKEGSVIEFTYKIESPFIHIDDIEMQYEIPMKVQEIRVSTPEFFVYNKLLNPRASYMPKIDVSKENVSIPISHIENIITSNLQDVPALQDEPLVDNIDNYRAKLILELALTKFPNRPIDSYSTTWEKVTETIYKSSSFGMQIDKKGYYEDDLDQLLTDVNNPTDKMDLIYNHVKSKVKWNEFYGLYSDEGPRKAYKEGAGNSADINLMLISMMRYAGLKANPVLVSTKNHGIPLLPTRNGFNYVICLVEGPDFNALLDATEEYSSINVLPYRTMNWQGRLIREDGTSDWITLSPTFKSEDITTLNAEITGEMMVKGKVRNQLTNHLAMRYRNEYANVNKDEYRKALEKDKGELVVEELEVKDLRNAAKPLQLTYSYNCADRIEEIGDKLYLSPMLFLASQENPFKQDSRKYPIDFNHPINDKYMINIKLPEGYAVETLPKSEKFAFNGTDGEYTYLIQDNGSTIQLKVNLEINKPLILSDEYQYFKNFYNLILKKQDEKVVLKRI